MQYRPKEVDEMRTPMKLQVVASSKYVNGVLKRTYKDAKYPLFYCNFKTYGGTEQNVNGVYSVLDTATLTTYFRPDIKSDCRVVRLQDNAVYEIVGEPENIEMANQYLRFKVKRTKGGA